MKQPSSPKPARDGPSQLLVEGKDDLYSVANLMELHGFAMNDSNPQAPFINDCDGYTRVLEVVEVMVKERQYKRIGIMVDANEKPADRWAQVKNRLGLAARDLRVDSPVPESPEPKGTIIDGFFPETRIGIWLMPDNAQPGALEDFLETLIPGEDDCWVYAEKASRESKKHGARFSDSDFKKARLHAWLAWQEKPGLPFGSGVRACYFRSDSDLALTFVEWFKRLFL